MTDEGGLFNGVLPNTLAVPPGGLMGQEPRVRPLGQHSLNDFSLFPLSRDERNQLQGSLRGAAIW